MKTIFFCLTLATCRLYAQHQDTLLLRHLPPDADAIYRFNLPVITGKLGWQELADRIPLPQQNTSARELAAILREPFRAGVDAGRDIFWTDVTGPTPGPPTGFDPNSSPHPPAGLSSADTFRTCSLLLHLADSGRFAAFLRNLEPGIHISSQDSICNAGRNGMGAAWNKSLLVISFITLLHPALSHSHHTTLAIRHSETMLRGYADSVRIPDPLFLKGFTDDADIDAWTAPGKISSLLGQYLLRLDHPVDYTPLIAAGSGRLRVLTTLRFEKGQVTVKSITPLPAGPADAWSRLVAHPVAPLPDHIPALNPNPSLDSSVRPLASLSIHINPRAVGDLLDSLHIRGRTESLLFDKGLSLENFVHAFQGDLVLAITSPDSVHPEGTSRDILTSSPPRTMPARPSLYAAIPLLDMTAFWQWMSRLKWLIASPDTQDSGRGNTRTAIGRYIPAWLVKDNCLIIAPDYQHALNWSGSLHHPSQADSSATGDNPALITPATDTPLILRVDLKNMAATAGHTLDQLLFTAGRLDANNQMVNTMTLTLTDSSQNSLRILFRLLQ